MSQFFLIFLILISDDRFESNISRIGASDLTMVSPSQKRAQQAKYAQQLAEGSSRPQSFRDDPYRDPYKNNDDGKAKPRRRQSVEVTIEDVNVISNIGQDSQMMKDQKKLQQQEYAQQLQSQQQQKQRQDSAPANPYISNTPRGQMSPGGNPYSARSNHTDSYNSSSPPSKSSVANFGPDPNAEAARKREMKIEYARQLQEQQNHKERSSPEKPRSAYREPAEQDRGSQRPMSMREYGADESKDDRGKSLSVAELKRLQQRQYHDEITMAAAAPAIYSERAPLKGGGQQRMQGDGYDSRNGPGTRSLDCLHTQVNPHPYLFPVYLVYHPPLTFCHACCFPLRHWAAATDWRQCVIVPVECRCRAITC